MKWIFLLLFLGIFFNLFRGLFFLLKEGGGSSQKVVQSLKLRVVLTVLVFFGLYISHHFGWIEGHGLREGLMKEISSTTP